MATDQIQTDDLLTNDVLNLPQGNVNHRVAAGGFQAGGGE